LLSFFARCPRSLPARCPRSLPLAFSVRFSSGLRDHMVGRRTRCVLLSAAVIALLCKSCCVPVFVGSRAAGWSHGAASRPSMYRNCDRRSCLFALAGDADDDVAATGKPWTVEPLRSALLGRRTVNVFEPVLPAGWEGVLRRAVEVACFAPNHRRTEPWRFHLLGPDAARAVCELNARLVAAKKGEEAAAKKLKRWLDMPGWLVVTQKMPEDPEAPGVRGRGGVLEEDYAACCCAVQNLCLSMHAEGLGTKWTTGPVNFDTGFPAAAGIPQDERVVGTIWFGKPADQPKPPGKKFSVDDVLRVHD